MERIGPDDLLCSIGATDLGDGRCRFVVWAPRAARVEVHIVAPDDRILALEPGMRGYHRGVLDGLEPGSRYFYRLNGNERPDPASRYQPEGVHGPSQVVEHRFDWNEKAWFGPEL